jgi:alkylation response protein AidB-like acyl-CoA dehydrogenase
VDFNLSEDLQAVRDLAGQIFSDRATPQRLRTVETGESRIDEQLWAELAKAGLVGVAVPESYSGAGLGLGGLSVLLEEQGRNVAPVPLWSAIVAALAVATHGSPEQRSRLLPGAVDGSSRLTLALEEFAASDPAQPGCTATFDGDCWRLTGKKAAVPSPFGATAVLVSAASQDGSGLFLVRPDEAGARWQAAETTTHDRSGHVQLDGVVAESLGAPGSGVLEMVLQQASVALAAIQLGVAQGALNYAAGYVREREQFGRPLGTFQAVQHQLADCYIEIDALRVTLWQAAADLADDVADAEAATLVAAWWAGEGGLDVVHRVQHVHGGIGVDTDYPVHRHFLWGKQVAGTLGGPSAVLARLGAVLAAGTTPR